MDSDPLLVEGRILTLDPDRPGRVRSSAATRGQQRSIVLDLDDAGLDTRITVSLGPSREMSSNSFFRRGIPIHTPTYEVEGHQIWGATARILADLLELI